MEITLGSKVRDKITGFTGTVVCRTDWLYGCRRYGVQSNELHDGKTIDSVYFDEPQLELIVDRTGGPRENENSQRKDPVR